MESEQELESVNRSQDGFSEEENECNDKIENEIENVNDDEDITSHLSVLVPIDTTTMAHHNTEWDLNRAALLAETPNARNPRVVMTSPDLSCNSSRWVMVG